MKRGMVLFLTLVLLPAMAVIPANAQEYDHDTNLITHADAAGGLAFMDDETLIRGGNGAILSAWDVTYGRQLWELDVIYGIVAVAVPLHDPFFIAYGGHENHDIRMRYSDDGDWRAAVEGHTDTVRSLAFKPNSYVLASASDDDTIRIWDVGDFADLRHVRTLREHTDDVYAVAWRPDGGALASASEDGTVRLWDVNYINRAVLQEHTDGVNAVAWSPDGRTLASGDVDGNVFIWHVGNIRNPRLVDRRDAGGWVSSLAFYDDETLVIGSWTGRVRIEDLDTGTRSEFSVGTGVDTGFINDTDVDALALSPDGEYLAVGWTHLAEWDEWIGHLSLYWRVDNEPVEVQADVDADVNGDGDIDVDDLVIVARNYGKTVGAGANRWADVNEDGEVDVADILAMIAAVDAAGAPALAQEDIETEGLQAADVRQWLRDAKAAGADPAGIAALERLLTALTRAEAPPSETVLLANYPNPFNPETWMPYALSESAEVTVSIYALDGKLVRRLALGQVPAGVYRSRSRAAYWDGRNAQGEPVASGVYFYTLQAGDFSATRRMVIRK